MRRRLKMGCIAPPMAASHGAWQRTVACRPDHSPTLRWPLHRRRLTFSILALQGPTGGTIGFYSSADSGATWTQLGVPPNDNVDYWGWSLRVHPSNPNIVYAGCLRLSRSTDGGKTWQNNDSGLHVDQHAQAYSADGSILYAGNDGGMWSTTSPTAATTWTNLNATLNTAMFYPGISISPTSLNSGYGGTQGQRHSAISGRVALLELCGLWRRWFHRN